MKIPSRSILKDDAWIIFRAGFLASGEGWNGEYPFAATVHEVDNGKRSKDTAYLYAQFEEWLSSGK